MTVTDDYLDLDDEQDPLLRGDPNEDTDTLRTLRERYKDAKKKAKSAKELGEENQALKQKNALLEAGLGELTEKQRTALFASHDGDLTPEKLRETAVEIKLAEPPEPKVPAEEQAAHERIAAAAGGAGTAKPGGAEIDAQEVKTWGMDRKAKFRRDHPEAWEGLLRGEKVKRPQGW